MMDKGDNYWAHKMSDWKVVILCYLDRNKSALRCFHSPSHPGIGVTGKLSKAELLKP